MGDIEKKTNPSRNETTPALANIDRNIAFGFSLLVLILMLIVALAGTRFYMDILKRDANQRDEIITEILADAINRVSFSGKYHARLLVEQLAESQPRIEYIFVVEENGEILAHSDPESLNKPLAEDTKNMVQEVLQMDEVVIRDHTFKEASVKQIALAYRSGYENRISGVIVVGISNEELKQAIVRSRIILGVLVLILTTLSVIATYLISKYFAGPVKNLAWQLKGFLDHAPLLVRISDRQGEIRETSSSFQDVAQSDPNILEDEVMEVFRTNQVASRELARIINDTQRKFFTTSFPILTDAKGKTSQACAIALDVTERRQAEEALRESEKRHRELTESLPQKIFQKDTKSVYVSCNGNYAKDLGISVDEIEGKTDFDFFPKEIAEKYRADDQRIMTTGKNEEFEEIYVIDGWEFTIQTVKVPLTDDDGNVNGILGIFWDITDRKRAEQEKEKLEEQLLQSQKMEAIGRLAGGVAHDFNNILTGINGYTEMILEDLQQDDPLRPELEDIKFAGERAAALTAQLLAFSRKQVISPKVLQPNDIFANSKNMLQRIIGEDIELLFHPAEDIGRIKMDPSQMDQILVNLVVNARESMPNGGKLILETENVTVDQEFCLANVDAEPGDFVMLSVTDTGHGMDEQTKVNIFEPFFSTKEKGQGTGLGLATVYGIIRQNHGFICVESKENIGTTFKVYFPRVLEDAEILVRETKAELPTGSETILLVEDEAMVRNMTKKMLLRLGYKVIDKDSGDDALAYMKEHPPGQIHMLLTDVIMPGMNGKQLFERLKENRSDLKVLFMSGYTKDVIGHHDVLDSDIDFMRKPFTIETIAKKIRKVLDK